MAGVAGAMVAHESMFEAPLAVDPHEAVLIAVLVDRLEGKVVGLLEDGDIRTARPGAGTLVDIDIKVGGGVPGPRCAIGVDDDDRVHLADGPRAVEKVSVPGVHGGMGE